jgi:hypothetical protein
MFKVRDPEIAKEAILIFHEYHPKITFARFAHP